jgi:Asp/Glu/hydantoin racemase
MMHTRSLVLIHTVSPLVHAFNTLCAEMLPGVRLLHILDEPLRALFNLPDYLPAEVCARLAGHIASAERIKADVVLVTCSTLSPKVDDIRDQFSVPILKIDEALISRAVVLGSTIGVVATAASALEPARQALRAEADRAGKSIRVEMLLVERALPALLAGDGATHDQLVKQAVLELAGRVEVVTLAQASMARLLAVVSEAECRVPILSSPHLALARVRQLLAADDGN